MNRKVSYLRVLVGLLVLLMAAPPGIMAQGSGASSFSQEELDQMLAPIALYPDSLLGQILVAATYPEQVTEADQWVRRNSNLQGDELNAALDRMDWDLSVKALVPFPQVLAMMSDKMDWTQRMGDAFLAQQADVMDTIQSLRAKAHAQGNLNSTDQQRVVVRGESIEIEPANPRVIYVPTYNPTVIYGSWWYPAYPPYAYNPYYPHYAYDPYYSGAGFITTGLFGFAAGIAVGSVWHSGWGHWDWHRHHVNININRTININRNDIRRRDIRHSRWNEVNRHRVSQRSGREAVVKSGKKRTSGKAALKSSARPTADSVQKGLKQRETKAQVRKGKSAAKVSQTKTRSRSDRGQRGSTISSERSKGQRGSTISSERSKGQRGSAISSERSKGGKGSRDGGSTRRGGKSRGGGDDSSGGGGHGGGGSDNKRQ